MPADTATLILRVRNDKYVRDMKKADTATKNLSGSSSTLKKVIGGIGFAVAARSLARFGVSAVKAASKAEETTNKFKTVFSDIPALAEDASVSLAKSFNLASVTAEGLLSNTGDLLVGFGFTEKAALDLSTQVNRLAIDLASFQNLEGGAQRASEALTKALLGETESAKSLGIVIRQNTKEYRDEVKNIQRAQGISETQAKAVNNLRIAYRQSTKALGDYERTQDSVANVGRTATQAFVELKQAIGETTLEMAKAIKLVGGTGSLSKLFIGSRQEGVTRRQFIESLIETITGLEDINTRSVSDIAAPTGLDLASLRNARRFKKFQEDELKFRQAVAELRRIELADAEALEKKGFELRKAFTESRAIQIRQDKENRASLKEVERDLRTQIRLQKLINAGKDREAAVQEALADIYKETTAATADQVRRIGELTGQLFDLQNMEQKAEDQRGISTDLSAAMSEGSAEAFRTIFQTRQGGPEQDTAKNTESIDKTLKRSLGTGTALVPVNLGAN